MSEPTEEDFARDAEADMMLCEAATEAPWAWEADPVTLYSGRTGEWHGLNLLGRMEPDRNGKANLDFIANAREALPAYIRLAAHYKAEADKYRLLWDHAHETIVGMDEEFAEERRNWGCENQLEESEGD